MSTLRIVLHRHTSALALICIAGCGGSHVASNETTTPAPSGGACIVDPAADAIEQVHALRQQDPDLYGFEPTEEGAEWERTDIDGDGTVDRMFFEELGTASGLNIFYVSNRGCWTRAGTIVSTSGHVWFHEATHHGFRDASAYATDGCAGREGQLDFYEWTGSEWTTARTVQCLCDEEAEPGVQRAPTPPGYVRPAECEL